MSKELEALENIKHYDSRVGLHESDYDIIENALKILEQLQVIIGAEKIEDLPKLALETENACYNACYDVKKAEKKLKALEIIKEKEVNVAIFVDIMNDFKKGIYNFKKVEEVSKKDLSEEEIKLLKEVLL